MFAYQNSKINHTLENYLLHPQIHTEIEGEFNTKFQ